MQRLSPATSDDSETEYRTIESALLESARGRWFLAEHGRRARRLDSALLEDAIGRLQTSLRQPPALLGQLQADGWQIDSSRAGEDYGRLLPPESEQLADRGPLGTSISFEPSRFLIELNAGYGMPWPANN